MSEPVTGPGPAEGSVTASPSAKKGRGRGAEVGIVLVILILVVGAAFFQEPIGAFFRLKLWDKGAPGRVVQEFMSAVQHGDQQQAERYIAARELKPMQENGKWTGFFMATQAGRLDYPAEDLAPSQGPGKVSDPEFNIEGDAAEVKTTVGNGQPLKYRLKMRDGSWKIVEIIGGRLHH